MENVSDEIVLAIKFLLVKTHHFILDKLGLREYFDIIVDPSSVKKGKPAPDILLKGAELIGIEPNEFIGIEDSEAGIHSINNSNIYFIGIGSESNSSHADLVISSTNELRYTLEDILNNR